MNCKELKMKPFITEEQLALYKYQRSSKYYGMPMSDILNFEFANFWAQSILNLNMMFLN